MTLGQNVGHEENGKNEHFERPGIVLKRLDRNLFLGIPLTSKNRNQYYKLLVGRNGSISQYAIWTQIRVLSTRRLMRKEGVISKEYFMQLRAIIKAFL
jgi:mRNA interferase MazF